MANETQRLWDLLTNRLTETRAAYLDELDFDLNARLGTPAGASLAADLATIDGVADAIKAVTDLLPDGGALNDLATILADTNELQTDWADGGRLDLLIDAIKTVTDALPDGGALTTIQADLDNPAQYKADLTTLETRLSAIRAGYLDQLDFNLQEAIAAIPTTMVGTDNAALAASWTAALATALGNYTAARAGYLDELAAANIPADIDALKASKGRQLFTMDFWSNPVEEKAVTAAQVTAAVGAAVTVEDLPAGATIVRAIVMMKFRMVENTNAAENSLDCTAVQPIQVDDSANTGWVDAIDFVDEQFKIAAETREGGDVLIGDNDVSARVDGNDTYDFQWLNAKAHLANIQLNDIAMGIRVWYSV